MCISNIKYDKAIAAYENAHEVYKNYAPDPTKDAQIMNNLGTIYFIQANYEQALPLYSQALVINQKAFGNNSTSYIDLTAIAKIHYCLAQYDEAAEFFAQALEMQKLCDVGDCDIKEEIYFFQGEIYKKQHQFAAAQEKYKAAYEIYKTTLPEDDKTLKYLVGMVQGISEYFQILENEAAETTTTTTSTISDAHFQMPAEQQHDSSCCTIFAITDISYDNAILHYPALLIAASNRNILNNLIDLGTQDHEVALAIVDAAKASSSEQVLEILYPTASKASEEGITLPSFWQVNYALKSLNIGVDALRLFYQPTTYNAYKLAHGATYLYSMAQGINSFASIMSAAEVIQNIYHHNYNQALAKTIESAAYMSLPLIANYAGVGEVYACLMTAITTYSLYDNAYNLYHEVTATSNEQIVNEMDVLGVTQ
jgi:tetratricopeptide (TPR) repeat protein